MMWFYTTIEVVSFVFVLVAAVGFLANGYLALTGNISFKAGAGRLLAISFLLLFYGAIFVLAYQMKLCANHAHEIHNFGKPEKTVYRVA